MSSLRSLGLWVGYDSPWSATGGHLVCQDMVSCLNMDETQGRVWNTVYSKQASVARQLGVGISRLCRTQYFWVCGRPSYHDLEVKISGYPY